MTTSDFARVSLIIFTAFFIDKNKKHLVYYPKQTFQDNIYPPLKATVVFMRVFEKVTRNLGKQVFKTTNGNEP